MTNYTPFLDLRDEPPHGCLRLVERVFRDAYGIDVGVLDVGVESRQDRAERLHAMLCDHTIEVAAGQEQEQDLIILRALPIHIGIVVKPGFMLHSAAYHHSCISRYRTNRWRVLGFYRYVK